MRPSAGRANPGRRRESRLPRHALPNHWHFAHAFRLFNLPLTAQYSEPCWLSPPRSSLSLPVPILQIPKGVVPAAEDRLQLARQRVDLRARYDRNDHPVLDHHVVHLDEECRSLDRVKLALGGVKGVVVGLTVPPGDISALPFVFFCGNFRRKELSHERFGIG